MPKNEDPMVSVSRSALDVLIADLERSRRAGWARAYAAEEQLKGVQVAASTDQPQEDLGVIPQLDEAAARRAALAQIDDNLRTITRWFKPLWYAAAWDAGHRRIVPIRAEDLDWALSLWGDRQPGQSGYIDEDGKQMTSHAPPARGWMHIVVGLLSEGISESEIEQCVHAAMATAARPEDAWASFMSEVNKLR